MLLFKTAFARVLIKGNVKNSNNSELYCYKPFKNFGNNEFYSIIKIDSLGQFMVDFEVDNPSFVKMVLSQQAIFLLVEPNDTLRISINDKNDVAHNWLEIEGINSKGNEYFNEIYNKIPIEKFYNIRNLFEMHSTDRPDSLMEYVKKDMQFQVNWLDSLYENNLITKVYADYMKVGIHSVLASEVGKMCDYFFREGNKSSKIKSDLFRLVDPLNPKLYSCTIGHPYYDTYFEELYKTQKAKIDTSEIIIDEVSYISLAPEKLKDYLWGRALAIYMDLGPEMYDYCELFNKYKKYYNHDELVFFIEKDNPCIKKELSNRFKIIKDEGVSLDKLIKENFNKQRLYIDLWATWCLPCKKEFKYYNDDFYRFMSSYNVKLLYISIDDKSKEDEWIKQVKSLSLIGSHVRADALLKNSIKKMIYKNLTVSIPRYILIDENGKIIADNAKRPSDTALKREIHRLFSSNNK